MPLSIFSSFYFTYVDHFFLTSKQCSRHYFSSPCDYFHPYLMLPSKLLFLSRIGNGEDQPIPHLRVLFLPNLWCEHLSKEPPGAGYCSTNTTVLDTCPASCPLLGKQRQTQRSLDLELTVLVDFPYSSSPSSSLFFGIIIYFNL